MSKTYYVDGDEALGIAGVPVLSEFLNNIQNQRHDGLDIDGHGVLDYYVAGGTANALTITCKPPLTAHIPGMPIYIKAVLGNTGPMSIAVDGLPVVDLVNAAGQPLATGDVLGGQIMQAAWDGARYQLSGSRPRVAIVGAYRALKLISTGTTALVSISAAELVVEDAAGNYLTLRSIAASASVLSSGAGGLDTGQPAASTWYSVWLIFNPATGGIAGLLSTSATAPTMPPGFIYSARVGWIRTDGTANKYPLAMMQAGNRAQYRVGTGNVPAAPCIVSGVQGAIGSSLVAVAVAAFVPPTATAIKGLIYNGGTNYSAQLAPNASAGLPGSASLDISGAGGSTQIVLFDFMLESSNLYYAGNCAGSGAYCLGWEDNL